jgi:hypothetical protein
MPMLNPFATDAFNMVALTAAINKIPNTYGRLEQLNLMPATGVRTRTIIIEEMSGVLNLLPTQPVGAPGTLGTQGKRKVRSFVIPHIPHDDAVLPEEVQGIRAFGSESETEALADLLALKLQNMRNKHAITLEHLRMGALKGVILDADGSTLYNLYDEFGITPKTVNFALGTASTEVLLKVLEVKRHIEDNLKGEFMTGILCLCSSGFYDAFTTHSKVKEAFQYYQRNQQLGNDYRTGFTFGGVTFEEYRGQATDAWQRAEVHRRRRGALLPAGHGEHLPDVLRAGGLQRDGEHLGPAALRQAGAAQVRPRHRPAHAAESAADLPAARGAGQGDEVLTMSSWHEAVKDLDAAVVQTFGREVLYLPEAGGRASMRAVFQPAREVRRRFAGRLCGAVRAAGGLPGAPARGDEVEIGGVRYKVFDIEADPEGAAVLKLRKTA